MKRDGADRFNLKELGNVVDKGKGDDENKVAEAVWISRIRKGGEDCYTTLNSHSNGSEHTARKGDVNQG